MPADSEIPPASKAARAGVLVERTLQVSGNANAFLPGIGLAAAAGVQLAQAIQIAEKNKEDFIGLGESCAEILEALSRVEPADDNERTKLGADAKRLEEVVNFVAEIVKKRNKKSWYLKKLWNHLTHKRIIEKCQSRIDNALKMFYLKGNVELRQKVTDIHAASAPSAGKGKKSDGGQPSTGHRIQIINERGTLAGFAVGGGKLSAGRIEAPRAQPSGTPEQGQAHEPSSDQRPAHVQSHSVKEPLVTELTRPAPTQHTSDPETYTGNIDIDLVNKDGGVITGFVAAGGRVNVGEGIFVN